MKDEFDELDDLNCNTGDPNMVLTLEEVKERYQGIAFNCADCVDTGLIGPKDAQDFCSCKAGEELKELFFEGDEGAAEIVGITLLELFERAEKVLLKLELIECPNCGKPGYGRKYEDGRRTVRCPFCGQESERT